MRSPTNISEVVKAGLCVGCGLCAAVAPNSWTIDDSLALPTPRKIGSESNVANAICPAITGTLNLESDARSIFDEYGETSALGHVSKSLIGFSTSAQRTASSSGGLLTEYLCELLEQGVVQSVIHVGSKSDGPGFEYVKSSSPQQIRDRCKTRYYPVNLSKLQEMLTGESSVALVANPCFTSSARRLSSNNPDNFGALKHFVSFFCGHWKTKGWTEYLTAAAELDQGSLLDYRSKIDGRPANKYGVKVSNTNSEKIVPMDSVPISGWQYGIFKPKLCDFCDDVGAEMGDVVFGDAWIKPESDSSLGTSVVLVRSPEAEKVISQASAKGTISVQDLPLARLLESQSATLRHRQEGLTYRIALASLLRKKVPPARVAGKLSLQKAALISLVRFRLAARSHKAWTSVKDQPNAVERFNQKLKFEILLLRVVNRIPSRPKK